MRTPAGVEFDAGHHTVATLRIEAVHRRPSLHVRRQHEQVVGLVDREIDGVERVTAHGAQPGVERPARECGERSDRRELRRAVRVDDAAAERAESIGELLHGRQPCGNVALCQPATGPWESSEHRAA